MKKISLFAILVSALAFTACEKAMEQPADWTSVVVINAAPSTTDTLSVFVDTSKYNSGNGIIYNANSTYLPVLAGNQSFNIRNGRLNSSPMYVNNFSYNLERGNAYSFFIYDTVPASGGTARVLKLKDDLTLPATGQTKVRFLHLAPNGGPVDITLVRTTVTPQDSITISNKTFIGANPDENALAAFMSVPGGTYTVKVKTAGTQTVLLSSNQNLTAGRIVTLYATGTAKGRPLAVGNFRHY